MCTCLKEILVREMHEFVLHVCVCVCVCVCVYVSFPAGSRLILL